MQQSQREELEELHGVIGSLGIKIGNMEIKHSQLEIKYNKLQRDYEEAQRQLLTKVSTEEEGN